MFLYDVLVFRKPTQRPSFLIYDYDLFFQGLFGPRSGQQHAGVQGLLARKHPSQCYFFVLAPSIKISAASITVKVVIDDGGRPKTQ